MANPFQELRARLEAEAKKNTAAGPASGPASVPGASKKPGARGASPAPAQRARSASPFAAASDEDDAALFLRSVTAAPLPKKPRLSPESHPDGSPMPSLTPAPVKSALSPNVPAGSAPSPAVPTPTEPSAPASAAPEDSLFSTAMRGVTPIAAKGRDIHTPAEPPQNAGLVPNPAAALHDLLDGKIEFAICHTEEYMEGFVAGLDPLIFGKLRSGSLSPEGHLDLHGQNARQALDSLILFMKNAYTRGLRTVLVVTGRGRNSPDGIGVLRLELQKWLTHDPFKRVVLAFCTAQPHDGGPGAVYVLLRKYKKSRGKIVWELGPGEDDGLV